MADPFLRSPKNPHFFQPLLPGFQSHLKIPVKFFSNHIEGKHEGKTMNLISDASERTWKVKMEGQRLTCGWKEFVETHDLRIGDVVIFRHEGDMLFHVTFLGPSCCEIQYSKNKEEESDEIGKEQNPETEANSFSLDQSCFIANVTDGSLREDRLFLPRKLSKSNVLKKGTNEIVLMNEGLSKWTFNLFFRESSQTFYVRLGWRSFCADNGFELGDSIIFKPESNNTKIPLLRFSKSDDRIVILTIESTSLRSCKSYLPVRFTRRNKMKKAGGKKINMLDKNGVKWPVSLLIEKVSRRMCLGSGLKDFVDAVGIKAYESFVLELVWEDKTSPPVLKFCYKIKNGP